MDLSKIISKLKAENLPLFDGANYFRTRGSGLLLPAMYFLTNNLDHPKIRENFQVEVQKAYLAIGDAMLLMTKHTIIPTERGLTGLGILENRKAFSRSNF